MLKFSLNIKQDMQVPRYIWRTKLKRPSMQTIYLSFANIIHVLYACAAYGSKLVYQGEGSVFLFHKASLWRARCWLSVSELCLSILWRHVSFHVKYHATNCGFGNSFMFIFLGIWLSWAFLIEICPLSVVVVVLVIMCSSPEHLHQFQPNLAQIHSWIRRI